MADVEHGARGWHGINKVASDIHRAALQIGIGKAAATLHGVMVILCSRVSFLLGQTAAERCCVRSQAIHVLLGFGKGCWRRRIVAKTIDCWKLAGISYVIWAA